MTKRGSYIALAVLVCTSAGVAAQGTHAPTTSGDSFHYRADRQIVTYENGHLLSQEGGWRESDGLRQFAQAHAGDAGGNFIVFHDADGVIHEIAGRQINTEVQAIYAPMRALNVQQEALAAQQKPLAAQQHALGEQMRAAATPAEMATLGREQGRIGHLQGVIGQQQGAIGQQQGAVGRAFYARLQTAIDTCLREGSCPVVGRVDVARR